jgi:hypothetical protein
MPSIVTVGVAQVLAVADVPHAVTRAFDTEVKSADPVKKPTLTEEVFSIPRP